MSARCKRCLDGVPHEIRHGITGYKNCHCRCQVCRAANSLDTKRYADGKLQWQKNKDDPIHRSKRRGWDRNYRAANLDEIRVRKRRDYERRRGAVLHRVSQYRSQNVASARLRGARYRCRRAESIENATFGPWLPHEDLVVIRADITILEMAHITGRTCAAVAGRRLRLLNPESARESSKRYRQRNPSRPRQLSAEQRARKNDSQRRRRERARLANQLKEEQAS